VTSTVHRTMDTQKTSDVCCFIATMCSLRPRDPNKNVGTCVDFFLYKRHQTAADTAHEPESIG